MRLSLGALRALAVTSALAAARALDLGTGQSARLAGCTGGCDRVNDELKAEVDDGFPSRPGRQSWSDQLMKVVQGGSSSPCSADIVATSYGRYMGFCSRMNTFADELFAAVYRGRSFSLCQSNKDRFIDRIWSPHFKNIANFSMCASPKGFCEHGNSWDTLHVANNFAAKLKWFDHEYLEDFMRFLYPYIFTLAEGTQHLVDQRLESAGLVAGEPYVAIHVRHGDKTSGIHREAEPIEADSYADAARSLLLGRRSGAGAAALRGLLLGQLRAANASVVYVASDDDGAAEAIGAALGGGVRVVQQPRGSGASYQSRGYEADEDLVSLLTDVEALRRARAFVGTASSNVGRLVYLLRPKGSASISLDKGGNWMWRTLQQV
ncbi:unnamed protein product [Prorocentrum cordatum]|uniref:Peptide-O-fucosyltransferase 1 n=1 Tax=Prorocentrum cordatum TaxID=2364126 RepID=A0ABN9U2I1_9DINO|nr:unnamed protein product [Polarella glacialis]|mmetsp:Transcript_50599/g.131525  ORF Transcript_50599/g.131525 Transcript_50599/m.131525 type:complete len:378 (+) Transcript_50599:102-1235(+)